MRHPKLVSISLIAVVVLAWACSSDDSGQNDGGNDAAPIDAGVDVTADTGADTTVDSPADVVPDVTALDAPSDTGTDAELDAGTDADALAAQGTPCTPPNDVQQQTCGYCGTQYRACLPDSDGGYAWGTWGYCQGEVVGGCDPNQTYTDIACGNCGTMKQVCLSNCTFDLTQTCNEPQDACKPGSTEFQLGLSCDGGGRERTCSNQCAFGNWGSCQAGPSIPVLDVPSTVGSINSLVQTFDSTKKLARLSVGYPDGACPRTVSTTSTPYDYIRIENTTGFDATIDVWHSQSATYIDTVMAVYDGSTPPADNDATARGDCTGYADDACYDTTITNPASCDLDWAGLMYGDGQAVTIANGASVVLYSATYSSTASGDFQINVKTEALQ